MYLNKDEEKMLSGEYGEGTRKALQYQVKIGDFFGAERMVPISLSMVGIGGGSPLRVGHKFFNELVDECTKFRVPIAIGYSDPIINKLSGTPSYGTGGSPIDLFAYPHYGSHVAANGSNPTCFFNTVIGARVNIEGGAGCMFAGITGRVPEYGFHLRENRLGKTLVKIKTELKSEIADWTAMGYYIGKVLSKTWWEPPVFVGSPPDPLWQSLVYFTASLPGYGSVVMAHIVGVTPEARTIDDAFGNEKPIDQMEFGQDELNEVYETFSSTSKNVDVVDIDLTVRNLPKIAKLLEGKKVHKDIKLIFRSSLVADAIAEKFGFRKTIEASGAKIDYNHTSLWFTARKLGIKTVVTNSCKYCHYIGQQGVEPVLMPLEDCIKTAITGKLE